MFFKCIITLYLIGFKRFPFLENCTLCWLKRHTGLKDPTKQFSIFISTIMVVVVLLDGISIGCLLYISMLGETNC